VPNSNLEQLVTAGRLLRPILSDLVFVGGSITGLLVTDEAAGDSRPTLDVDVITASPSYAAYSAFAERLRSLGFSEDQRPGAPLCRWIQRETVLDVMPLDESILGFSNRWYEDALHSAARHRLADDLEIRIVSAPFFLATKLEAFKGRGGGDFFSHDLEDIVSVVDGRESLIAEVRAESRELQSCLQAEIGMLLSTPGFLDALPGFLLPDTASQSRIGLILVRLQELARAPSPTA
jgi:hypothetical protein